MPDVYESASDKPSDGDFRSDIRDAIKQILSLILERNSPFLVNIYPFLSLNQNTYFPEEFAFFDGQGRIIQDKDAQYSNVFYQGILKKMAHKKGTPLHPGAMDIYLFSLTDENLKSIEPGNFERHWEIFRYDGRPKFPIDFSGQGQDKWPVAAKGVVYQERFGCSCENLDLAGNASFAFNQYFQTRDQSVEACDFNGMATIVKQDPSKGSCLFPIEIQSSGEMLRAMCTIGSLFIGLPLFFITFT
ncbi:Glucan endo-1,3-beta-glucosidase 5 [Glycine soja]|uniref:glucan endo-1,3-beta-D-glucosidase n=1 Tax=Glycine soja TaxID=3848 RepID=A0A445L3H6_GLYSO|nr:Glucan endo-1,3-beta-glucosidase 5 [Glycine soja]